MERSAIKGFTEAVAKESLVTRATTTIGTSIIYIIIAIVILISIIIIIKPDCNLYNTSNIIILFFKKT